MVIENDKQSAMNKERRLSFPSYSLGLTQYFETISQKFQNEKEKKEEDQEKKEGKIDAQVEYPDSEETEDDETILEIKEKRVTKPSAFFVLLTMRSEKVFKTNMGNVLSRGMAETIHPRLWLHAYVIDAWAAILNHEEKMRSDSTKFRYFFDTTIVRDFLFDENIHFTKRCENFESIIKDTMKKDKDPATFKKVDLVFFTVHQKDHYYLISMNLKDPAIDVLDKRNSVAKISNAYKGVPEELILLFCSYLRKVKHKSASQLENVEPQRLKMNWRTRGNYNDCGVFCMRHMETYMGDSSGNWSCGLHKESAKQQQEIDYLRLKYLTNILLSGINQLRDKIIAQTEKFAKKSPQEIDALVKNGWEKRTRRI
ncbi:hypothetical protein LXL04_033735 [Taraxacum kok-saghyz]